MNTEKPKRPYVRALKTYVVSNSDGDERLVRAYSSLEAIKHCMPVLGVHLATQDDIIALMSGGVPVETAQWTPDVAAADASNAENAGLTD
jgi:predicted metal-dependent HD superfamily phosphohydrolase